jgi:competence protein ComEC
VGVFGFLSTQSANDEVIMLNVGQGDSFVFRSGGKTLMVDTGNEPEMLYAALARNNISKLDAVLITHPDSDHCGSLSELAGVVEVDKIILADGLDEVEDVAVSQFVHQTEVMVGTQNVEEVATGSQICFGKFTFQVVAPNSITNDGGNEDSICFYLLVDCDEDGKTDWTGFFCGDAEAEELENLEEEGQLLPVDIYKVGHHGSKKALTSELAHVLNPRIALIGVGKNSYGHPTQETLSTLGSVGAQIFRSDECGDVTCEFKQDAIDVSTSK